MVKAWPPVAGVVLAVMLCPAAPAHAEGHRGPGLVHHADGRAVDGRDTSSPVLKQAGVGNHAASSRSPKVWFWN
jgi:hypothetical protein